MLNFITRLFLLLIYVNLAAHCIKNKGGIDNKKVENILVALGAYDLDKKVEEGKVERKLKSLKLHFSWNVSDYRFTGDIAVLKFITPIEYSIYIRPICMGKNDIKNIKQAKIHGWGVVDDSQKRETIARKIEMPILEFSECFKEDDRLARIHWTKSLCAGKRGGGVCEGDSGSGLVVKHDKKYYLRGLVSSAIIESCNISYLALYTDVTEYQDFIDLQIANFPSIFEVELEADIFM